MLYDADAVHELAATPDPAALYEAQLRVFLDPRDPAVIRQAERTASPISSSRRPGTRPYTR